jgi:carbamoylphosphate synthase large subunit
MRCALGEVMAGGQTAAEAYARVLRAAGRGRAGGSAGSSLQELEKAV